MQLIQPNPKRIQFPICSSKGIKGSWEFDLQEPKLHWSPEQYKVYGYEANELELNDEYFITNTTHPSEVERITYIIQEALKSHENYNFKRRIIKKDGSIGFVQTEALIVRSSKGIATKIIGSTADVISVEKHSIYDYNDPAFFSCFYNDYKRAINNVIFKLVFDSDLAKDLCQEIFLKAWNNMSKYDPAKGALYTWLINIARNHCKDYLKSKYFRNNRLTKPFDSSCESISSENNFEECRSFLVRESLFKLSILQREIIDLIFMQGYTQLEVAKIKNLPLGTVKTRSRAAIQKLRKTIDLQSA